MRELAQADAAEPELPIDRARTTAAVAARVRPHLVLGLALLLDAKRRLGHLLLPPGRGEREAQGAEQRAPVLVRLGRRGDRDVEAANRRNLVVVDLGKDDLLADPDRVVAAAVERAGVETPEVANPRERDRGERSRNSYIRAPRSVTRAPTGIPSRSLKLAIDFVARRTCARWPEITVSSSIAASSAFASVFASPTPMFRVTFVTRGTSMTVEKPRSSWSCGRISASYRSFRRGTYVSAAAAALIGRSPGRSPRACTRGRGRSRPSPRSRRCRRVWGCRTRGRRP